MIIVIDQFKQIAKGVLDSQQLADVLFGTVTTTTPLEINVNQKFTLPESFIVVPEHLTTYEIDAKHVHNYLGGTTGEALPEKLLIRRGLETGDKVILIRAAGGGQYVVLGRVTA